MINYFHADIRSKVDQLSLLTFSTEISDACLDTSIYLGEQKPFHGVNKRLLEVCRLTDSKISFII